MSTSFECFVTFNDRKHTIIIDKHIDSVNFGDVYQQLKKVILKPNISYETHVFEIFDFDVNGFKRLTSFSQSIKCLARIRVLPSFVRNEYSIDTNGSPSVSTSVGDLCSDPKWLKMDNNFAVNRDGKQLQPNISFNPLSNQEFVRKPLFPCVIASDPVVPNSSPLPTHCPPNDNHSKKFKPIGEPMSQPISEALNKRINEQISQRIEELFGTTSKRTVSPKTRPKKRSNDSLTKFKNEGLVEKEDKTYCKLCSKTFINIVKGVEHLNSIEHMRNGSEAHYTDIDKQFLTEIKDKNNRKYVWKRKTELNKYKEKEKIKLIKHGIRLKDGFGSESYVCLRCEKAFADSDQMLTHFSQFLDLDMISDKKSNSDQKSDKQSKRKKNKYKKTDIKPKAEPIDFKVPKDMAEDVEQLERQGFRLIPINKKKFVLKCRLCDISTKNISKAKHHIRTEEHNKWKTEFTFRGIDRLIATENVTNNDLSVVLARIEVIRTLALSTKEDFVNHGIKVMDGFGASAYVCTKCNLLLKKEKECKKHLKEFDELKQSLLNRSTHTSTADDTKELSEKQIELLEQLKCNNPYIDILFRNEGIKYRKYDKTVRKQLLSENSDTIPDIYYFCVFCNTNFYSKETALYHLNRPIHKKIKCGDYMSPIETMFTVKSERVDELDIAFARMEALYRFDNKTKIDLRDKGIRLKDGIGSDAYICLKCNLSIASETIDSATFAIIRHTNSPEHIRVSARST